MKKVIIILSVFIGIAVGSATPVKYQTVNKIDSVYICQSKSAYAYHRYECRGLQRCTHSILKIPKASAIKLGYKACKICYR
ncbi:hypothetical protein [Mucilaginibacter ginsenosidivorans]|uniref:Ada DNA repair metal-binding domain-containing protein n=1 Tax=Mucilaginibacter ginsenosidivorans TaxID=398053 RepID=A0A5B8URP5_9SPHI|nr:hypothetical protein [Mucilaginibacter ginsenosidivorans]QEC61747.1 hypothetical protein FRZ54_03820 [Mucilaginibacter ginsenosidivorans]